MKVLITGGCGFIGTNLADHLLEESDVALVRTLDNYETGLRREHASTRLEMVEGDLRNARDVVEAADGMDAIVHLGALPSVPRSINDPLTTNAVNIDGTLHVLEAARVHRVGHVSVASSSSVYGANPVLPKHEGLATRPLSPYAVTKLATESYTNAYATSFGLNTIAFRFFNVFGPLQRADHVYAAVIPKFLEALKNDRPLIVHGDGEQSRDFTSIHSVTDALCKAALRSVTSDIPVNLAFGSRYSLNDVIALLQEIHPAPIRVQHVDPRTGDVKHSQAASDKIRELIPDVKRPAFEASLKEVYDWYMGC